jgi:hypothetical protein
MRINLVVQYYRCSDPDRKKEIDFCLSANLDNRFIDKVHLLVEEEMDTTAFPSQGKILQVVIGERMTFERVFLYANDVDPEGFDIWITSNADIYFDETLQYLHDADLKRVVFALTRHDVQKDGTITPVHEDFAHGCQDSWVFRTPVDTGKMFTRFNLGVPGCDGRIVYEFIKACYKVINPSLRIIAYHLDLTRESDIHERNAEYFQVMNEEGYSRGAAAPPPYQYYIYPVDQIDPDTFDMYRSHISNLTELGRRPAEMSRQLGRQFMEMEELRQQIEVQNSRLDGQGQQIEEQLLEIRMMGKELHELGNQYAAVLNSLSWKIMAPLRKILDLIK